MKGTHILWRFLLRTNSNTYQYLDPIYEGKQKPRVFKLLFSGKCVLCSKMYSYVIHLSSFNHHFLLPLNLLLTFTLFIWKQWPHHPNSSLKHLTILISFSPSTKITVWSPDILSLLLPLCPWSFIKSQLDSFSNLAAGMLPQHPHTCTMFFSHSSQTFCQGTTTAWSVEECAFYSCYY